MIEIDHLIEAGHFYECNGPSNMSLKGWQIGKDRAEDYYPDAEMALYIDDYHAEQPYLEKGEVFSDEEGGAEEMIAQADHVFYEREVAAAAPLKFDELLVFGNSNIKVKKGVATIAGIRLGEVDEADELFNPTCAFLDYVLLCIKAGIAPTHATVLPATYEKQQTNLLKVLGKLDVPGLSGYTVILFEPDGHGRREISL